MRKGQEKILNDAQRNGYGEGCIKILSRTDLTLKELSRLYDVMAYCRDQSEEWLEVYVSIKDYEIQRLIIKYMTKQKILPTIPELRKMTTTKDILAFFSKEGIICNSTFDVEVIAETGYHEYTVFLIDIARRLYDLKMKQNCEHGYDKTIAEIEILNIIHELQDCISLLLNYKDFLNGIDINKLSEHKGQYLYDYKRQFALVNALFKLNSAKGIPKEIQQMDFHGYDTEIKTNGFSRYVDYDLKAVFITYKPFSKVCIKQNGTIRTNTWDSTAKKLIFSNTAQEFITGYETKKGYRYKPTQLKELFLAISIHDTDEDEQNAYGVINFLCQKYDTYIFRDLYKDFLESSGFLLPLLITETAQYRTKQELFDKHYHMSINGNWNKKNANLTYLILKLRPRMTDKALARAMQCKNDPKIKQVGKRRYIMTYILYEALYSVSVGNFHGDGPLSDALYEEYQDKKIKLLPENQTINEHNARQMNQNARTAKFRIKKNTKFKKLIENMPNNYELIKTPKRLVKEGTLQKNCVASYDHKINSDCCMIYSVVFENIRHTIEIIYENGNYKIAQCYKACNQAANPQLLDELKQLMNKINKGGTP